MRLTSLRIQNYKVIDDTQPVPVDDRVTALVGKNEAGKSSILRALWKSRNVASKAFDKLYDYPRDRFTKERNGNQEVTRLVFSLEDGEASELKALFPDTVAVTPKEVYFITSYKGSDKTEAVVRFEDTVEAGNVPVGEAAADTDALVKAREWVTKNLPVFIYFDNYGQLETRINLPLFISRRGNPDPKIRTQQALFEWSGLDPQEILNLGKPKQDGETDEQVQRRKETRHALLESASFGLTGDWIQWWSEKRHKLHFSADGDDLVLKVSDDHNPFQLPFEERSHGLQWFFSFYLVFLVESKKAHKGAILLLDEPGLSLHPTLQNKLLKLFDRIADKDRVGDNNQLLYSTHLPFLVDGDHLERVRTVHLAGADPQKTVVSNNVRPTGDRDTLFPIQAAVGYSIAQTLFLGKRSLIVEGITDYWLLKALDSHVNAAGGGTALHGDTVLVPAGGTSRLMPLASIMLGSSGMDGRKMLVLLDSDTEGQRAATAAQRELFGGDDSRILMLGSGIGLKEATIEDMIPRDEYLAALKEAGFETALNATESKSDTLVGALDQAFQRLGRGKFSTEHKAAAALKLLDRWAKDPKSIHETTRKMASTLFAAVNARFDSPDKTPPASSTPPPSRTA